MPTRNGKKYLISHKCHACNIGYYSDENFDYKCSGCWEYCKKNGIMTNKEFGEKCRQWAKDNTVEEDVRKFILRNKHISDQHLYNFLTGIFVNTEKYISAETGLELFKENPTNRRGHILGSFISDWWEIKSSRVSDDKKWPRFMDCYYGLDDVSIENWSGPNHASIPPKNPRGPNNDFIDNKILMNIKYN